MFQMYTAITTMENYTQQKHLSARKISKIHLLQGFGVRSIRTAQGFRVQRGLPAAVARLILGHTDEGMRQTPAQVVRNATVAKDPLQVGASKPYYVQGR